MSASVCTPKKQQPAANDYDGHYQCTFTRQKRIYSSPTDKQISPITKALIGFAGSKVSKKDRARYLSFNNDDAAIINMTKKRKKRGRETTKGSANAKAEKSSFKIEDMKRVLKSPSDRFVSPATKLLIGDIDKKATDKSIAQDIIIATKRNLFQSNTNKNEAVKETTNVVDVETKISTPKQRKQNQGLPAFPLYIEEVQNKSNENVKSKVVTKNKKKLLTSTKKKKNSNNVKMGLNQRPVNVNCH